MSNKKTLRDSLESSGTLDYIKYNIKKRGFSGDSDTLSEIQGAVIQHMLEYEEYYDTKFKYSIKTYINQVVTMVFDRYGRTPDALNGDLVFLDSPNECENGYEGTLHEAINNDDSLLSSSAVYTQPGMVDKMTYYLAQLPEMQADVFAMKAVYGHTHEEISNLLDISVVYSKKMYAEAKRELHAFRRSEEAYEAQMEIGNVCGRIISNDASDAGVWNDWSWREEHAEAGPVKHYSQAEIADYCRTL